MRATSLTILALIATLSFCGCQPLKVNNLRDRLAASNFRDWSPQFSKLPYAVGNPDGTIQIFNIRNNSYLTENDFVANYYDRTFDLQDVRTVDYVVCPFKGHEFMAHTMLSFGLSDGTYIGFSAEIRTEKGEVYSPAQGLSRQYEIAYVIADEKDIIRLRTRYRDADVYIYQTVATPEQSQVLLVDMLERANKLAQKPEFYNTISNNCTTNLLTHVNKIKRKKLFYNWKIFLPGYSAEYAYDEGILDRSRSFTQLTQESWINDLASRHMDDPDFSQKIRQRLPPIDRTAASAAASTAR